MKKPDVHFNLYVSKVRRYHPCAEEAAERERGLIGFHQGYKCPNCKYTDDGFEVWGENGHLQTSAANRSDLARRLRLKVREQWKTKDGRIMGYRVKQGSALSYYA